METSMGTNAVAAIPLRIFRNSMAHFHGLQDLADLETRYTDAWFSKLRDHGFNGLWIGEWLRRLVAFRENEDTEQQVRILALRRLAKRAARYDVGVYLFLNEPKAFPRSHRIWTRFPEMRGAAGTWPNPPMETSLICTSTETGKAYVVECAHRLHRAVPELAGTIHINASEKPTHCYCHTITNPGGKIFSSNQEHPGIYCPRCAARTPEEVVAEILNLYLRGCRDSGSRAPVMAWNWNWIMWGPHPQAELLRRLDPEIMVLADFECGGHTEVYGRPRPVNEYSLVFAGPSAGFQTAADCARRHGHLHCAKLQIGTTHEMGAVANMPLLGHVYEKLAYLCRTGCHGIMACYNFGCMFSMNTAAVGLCCGTRPPADRSALVTALARDYLGGADAERLGASVAAIEAAFRAYPLTNPMVHRGPFSYAMGYPIDDAPLTGRPPAPSYALREFGDDWSQAMGPYTLEDVIGGLERMTAGLKSAVAEFERALFPRRSPGETCLAGYAGPPAIRLESDLIDDEENAVHLGAVLPAQALQDLPELAGVAGFRRLQEWCNARAMLGTVRSARNIFLNYRAKRDRQPDYREFLRALQRDECANIDYALPAYRLDARLGFHIEAFAYLTDAARIEDKRAALTAALHSS